MRDKGLRYEDTACLDETCPMRLTAHRRHDTSVEATLRIRAEAERDDLLMRIGGALWEADRGLAGFKDPHVQDHALMKVQEVFEPYEERARAAYGPPFGLGPKERDEADAVARAAASSAVLYEHQPPSKARLHVRGLVTEPRTPEHETHTPAGTMPERCPTCTSPAPHLHPAVQYQGEVHVCPDDFHQRVTPENTPERLADGGTAPE